MVDGGGATGQAEQSDLVDHRVVGQQFHVVAVQQVVRAGAGVGQHRPAVGGVAVLPPVLHLGPDLEPLPGQPGRGDGEFGPADGGQGAPGGEGPGERALFEQPTGAALLGGQADLQQALAEPGEIEPVGAAVVEDPVPGQGQAPVHALAGRALHRAAVRSDRGAVRARCALGPAGQQGADAAARSAQAPADPGAGQHLALVRAAAVDGAQHRPAVPPGQSGGDPPVRPAHPCPLTSGLAPAARIVEATGWHRQGPPGTGVRAHPAR